MPAPTTLRLVDPEHDAPPLSPMAVTLPDEEPQVSFDNGAMRVVHGDGSSTIDFNPDLSEKEPDQGDFDRNIANEVDPGELSVIASDIITGIEFDEQSRKEWLETRSRGITLLGLKLAEPRGDVGTTGAPLEGMSTIRHPLLLDATIRFQATARGELLPATGPVKVRNDATAQPENIGQPGGPMTAETLDELGTALETDMNHYLTVTASEYVPDTDRMLFQIGFGGDGFKKVYHCPIRRRPVSESIDAEDIIVSNAATDIRSCGRVTHKIKMRRSTLKRMQIAGAYRDVSLALPTPSDAPNPVEQKKSEVAGIRPQTMRSEDADYTIFECFCECDIQKFAPEQFKDKGLPLPYIVTIEKESRQVLSVKRNWREDDKECLPKQHFVQFPFIRGLGFYGLGLVHVLGNITMALTAIYREFIDAGMFANFPGMLHAKGAGRQLSNQMRVPPGGSLGIEVPPGMRIQDAVMPMPYKEPGASFAQITQHIEELGQRLGQTAEINIGEGKQETPVGTTMALIEQATKVMDSVHKRLHAAQAEEFGLLKERFEEDPEAFWRHSKRQLSRPWTADQFKQALKQRELVPVADPNNPTSLHRIAKAVALLTLSQSYGQFFNVSAVLRRIFRVVGIDPEGLFNAQPTPPPPDPRMVAIQAKAQAEQQMAQIQLLQTKLKAQQMQMDASDKAQDRASRERIEQMQLNLERMRVQQEAIIHAHDMQQTERENSADLQHQHMQAMHQHAMDQAEHQQGLVHEQQKHAQQMQVEQAKVQTQVVGDVAKHHAKMQTDQHAAEQKIENERRAQEAKAELEREKMRLEREKLEMQLQFEQEKQKMQLELQRQQHQQQMELQRRQADAEIEKVKAEAKAMNTPQAKAEHKQELAHNEDLHKQKLEHGEEQHKSTMQQKQAMARTQQAAAKAKAKAKPKGDK